MPERKSGSDTTSEGVAATAGRDTTPPSPGPTLTTVAQDYLKVIWTAGEWSGEQVSTKMLAERIGVSASTVSEAVRKLSDQGLVDHARYGSISLTERGRAAAVAMVRRHRLIETYLVGELGYGWDEVHDEAEVLEHAVSDLMIERIDTKLGHPERDPHGDPIPARDGTIPAPRARTLVDFADGECGVVARISDSDPAMLRYFDTIGIALDVTITVIERRDYAGTLSVRLGDPDDAAAGAVELGTPAAEAIWLVDR